MIGLPVVVDLVHDVTDVIETGLVLHLAERLIGGADEDEVADGWHEAHGEAHLLVGHRHVVLEVEFVELFLEAHQTGDM